jgi:hypothetical protein
MGEALELRLVIDGDVIAFPATVEDVRPSPHTGRPLRELHTGARFHADTAERVTALLEDGKVVDADGQAWDGRLESESYSDPDGPRSLSIRWKEHESVKATALEFLGITAEPTRYREGFEDGAVRITFQATLSAQDSERLRSARWNPDDPADRYWPVLRHGVSDEPVRMRLGRVLWSRREDDAVDYQVTLVQDVYDEVEQDNSYAQAFGGEPAVGNLKRQVSSLVGQMDELLRRLDNGETLGPEAADAIRAAGKRGPKERRHTYFEVGNLDKWWPE